MTLTAPASFTEPTLSPGTPIARSEKPSPLKSPFTAARACRAPHNSPHNVTTHDPRLNRFMISSLELGDDIAALLPAGKLRPARLPCQSPEDLGLLETQGLHGIDAGGAQGRQCAGREGGQQEPGSDRGQGERVAGTDPEQQVLHHAAER